MLIRFWQWTSLRRTRLRHVSTTQHRTHAAAAGVSVCLMIGVNVNGSYGYFYVCQGMFLENDARGL
jgi:hypothetical protein